MTLTFTLDLDSLKMNQCAKYVSRMSFSSKLIVYTNTHTQRHTHNWPLLYLDHWTDS